MKPPKVLLFLRLPPRLTGATLMNSFVNESALLRQHFRINTIRIPHAKSADRFGEKSIIKLFGIFLTQIKLFFTLLLNRPKFVYFQISPLGGAFIRDVLFVFIIKLLKVRILFHMHGKGIAEERKKRYFNTLYKFVFRGERVICLTQSLTLDIKDVYNGVPYIIPNVIKTEIKEEVNHSFSGKLNIMFISNLFIFKGIYVFLEALSGLKKRNVPFNARIIGSEAQVTSADIENTCLGLKLEKEEVQYIGAKYGSDKWDEYKRADVLVFPTLNDIWGLVLLEAMQASIPVIASIDGAIPEIVEHEKTGFLVEKNKPGQICNYLEKLYCEPSLINEMGKNGRKYFLETYSYEKFEQNMLETFKSVAK